MIKEMLEQNARAYRTLGHPNLLYEYVLKQGQEYTGFQEFPDEIMEPNQCYFNATCWAFLNGGRFDKLDYVEGFVVREGIGLLIQHAWVVADGVPYDPTLADNSDCAYFGVAYDIDKVYEETLRTGYYGLFIPDGMVINTTLMSEDEPDLVKDVRESVKASSAIF